MDGINASPVQESFEFAPRTGFAALDDAVRQFGARPAIDFLGKRWTWAELGRVTDRAAAGLQRLGVGRGVKVGLCLPNSPYSIIMFHAILKAGGTVVNFNPLYSAGEIEKQAKNAGTAMMVSLDLAVIHGKIAELAARGIFSQVIVCSMTAILPVAKSILFRLSKRRELAKVPLASPYTSFARLIAGARAPTYVPIDAEHDIAVLQFTGGTTGLPKAAMLTHANIAVNVQQILRGNPGFEPGRERIMGILPLFHVFAMTAVMNLGLALGAEMILLPSLNLKQLMASILRHRPTILPGVPTLYAVIGGAAEAADRRLDFIKYCICGGAPIAEEVARRFERVSHCRIMEGYGLSETSPVVTLNEAGAIRSGSVGRPLPGTVVEIRDLENPALPLPQGGRGEICIRGPQVMQGYYDHPAETADAFIDGAFRTGDVGYLDADGYLFIVDRIKDLIICGGYNVYPRVIEEAAYLYPGVQEAIAIGVPNRVRGQVPKLFVTLQPGTIATPHAIRLFLAQRLRKMEVPRSVEIRDTLPKTMVGKLSKKELVAEEGAKSGISGTR